MFSRTDRLWRKAKRGDLNACGELLKLHYTPIYAYLRRLCHNTEEAEDLTQETFAKVWRTLPAQQHIKNFRSWIYQVAHNAWIDACRKPCREAFRDDAWWDQLPHPEFNHALKLANREVAERLWRNVQHLDDEMKNTVILHYYQGLSLRETAAVLEVCVSTVKNRLHDAIHLLRDRLGAELNSLPHASVLISGKGIRS